MQRTAAEAATEAEVATTAADPANSASMEETKPSYVAADHMDVDPYEEGYLLERLIADG
jgi:hypothetical protein